MSKKKVIIILIIGLLIIGLIAMRIINIINKEKTSINDFNSLKELIEYDGHKYISINKSEEDGFEKDIYIEFSKEPINTDGTTNKNLYEILIKHIAGKIAGHNFRLIDESKDIIIRIKFDGETVTSYTINNYNKYWSYLSSNYQIDNYEQKEITNFTIKSQILINSINKNWEYDNINFGTKDSYCSNYDIYFDEGYKVRKINTKVYNIVFTSNYKNEVINQITTKSTFDEIKSILGEPTFKNDTEDIIGYKNKDIYIFFGNDGISIYPIDEYNETDSKKFGKLVTELNNTGDANTFLNKLTDLYSDYETYYKTDSYVNLIYPLRGLEIIIGAIEKNGLTIYSNFNGYITEDITIEDLKNDKKIPANVYTKLDINLVLQAEERRVLLDETNRNPYFNVAKIETNEYAVLEEGNIYSFYSSNKTKIDSELNIPNFSSIINYGQTIFIYGVKNDGIYKYNAENTKLEKIFDGQGEFIITKIENDIIYYDNQSLNIE